MYRNNFAAKNRNMYSIGEEMREKKMIRFHRISCLALIYWKSHYQFHFQKLNSICYQYLVMDQSVFRFYETLL